MVGPPSCSTVIDGLPRASFRPLALFGAGIPARIINLSARFNSDNDSSNPLELKTDFTFEPGNLLNSTTSLPVTPLHSSTGRKRKLVDQSGLEREMVSARAVDLQR